MASECLVKLSSSDIQVSWPLVQGLLPDIALYDLGSSTQDQPSSPPCLVYLTLLPMGTLNVLEMCLLPPPLFVTI